MHAILITIANVVFTVIVGGLGLYLGYWSCQERIHVRDYYHQDEYSEVLSHQIMTHEQFDRLNRFEQSALSGLEALKFQNNPIHNMIRNNLHTAHKFRFMLRTLREMIADNPELTEEVIGEDNMLLVVQAVDENGEACQTECEGFCWHQTTT